MAAQAHSAERLGLAGGRHGAAIGLITREPACRPGVAARGRRSSAWPRGAAGAGPGSLMTSGMTPPNAPPGVRAHALEHGQASAVAERRAERPEVPCSWLRRPVTRAAVGGIFPR
ncbi:hypothetical protein GCM10010116_53540 [Microbispora rosea subsp. aerata]|nr:hypothetical protein GCM10010116_53540 [Microbispora rosea subsp. aerata]GIH58391.1 hypothetical protein Mro02_53050 [Microbispora rosea subsp. aerata]GLJ84036.1 hypothetical protein GCM10017588_27640 [Microbispora rosea subsp. aerata]